MVRATLNPNRSIRIYVRTDFILSRFKDIVKDIAGYDKTISATRCQNKTVMT